MCRPIILQNPKRTHLLKEKVNNKMAQQKKDKEKFSAFLDELGKRLNKFRKSVLKDTRSSNRFGDYTRTRTEA